MKLTDTIASLNERVGGLTGTVKLLQESNDEILVQINGFKQDIDLEQRAAQEREIRFAETLRITTLFHYYLEFILLPLYNSTYNTNYDYEYFKSIIYYDSNKNKNNQNLEIAYSNAQKLSGKINLSEIKLFNATRNNSVHFNDKTDIAIIKEYVLAVKNIYNNNINIQKSLRGEKVTIQEVFKKITDDDDFDLME